MPELTGENKQEVTITFSLEEIAVLMGAIDYSLISTSEMSDSSILLAMVGTKVTDAFKERNG